MADSTPVTNEQLAGVIVVALVNAGLVVAERYLDAVTVAVREIDAQAAIAAEAPVADAADAAADETDDSDLDGRQLDLPATFTVVPYESRLFCECCGFPTLDVSLQDGIGPSFESAGRACGLCDWENPPLTADGAPAEDHVATMERNSGISLGRARANFARYLSMYDPSRLEPWMIGPPSQALLDCKAALRNAYVLLLAARPRERRNLWHTVRQCEQALTAREEADREAADDSAEDSEE
jgi:hypothetical protein